MLYNLKLLLKKNFSIMIMFYFLNQNFSISELLIYNSNIYIYIKLIVSDKN